MNFSASSNQFCSVVYVSIMHQLFKHQNNDCWIQDQDLTHVNLQYLGLNTNSVKNREIILKLRGYFGGKVLEHWLLQ